MTTVTRPENGPKTRLDDAAAPSDGRLGPIHLRLAIMDVLREPLLEDRTLMKVLERLWREDPETVTAAYDEILLAGFEDGPFGDGSGRHGLRAERMKELRRPLPPVKREGRTVAQIAERIGLSRETTARLLEHHGYLEMCPFGRTQDRRLVSEAVLKAGHGGNVDPSHKRSVRLDGGARAAPFPVFFEEDVDDIAWTFGWNVITDRCAAEADKKQRLAFLLGEHGYLPDEEIARLAGYSEIGVRKARHRNAKAGKVRQKAA